MTTFNTGQGLINRDAPMPEKRPISILYFLSANTDTFIFIL